MTPTLKLAPQVALVATLCACVAAQSSQPPAKSIPVMYCNESTDGFCEIEMSIQDSSMATDGMLTLKVAAIDGNKPAGLRILIAPEMQPGQMNPVTLSPQVHSLYRGGIRFQRTGAESDTWLVALALLYGIKHPPAAMDEDIHFTAYPYRGDPATIAKREVLFELSHDDPKNAVPQCQFLLEVNLPANKIRLREENQDFRPCMIRVLAKPQTE
jgi:hypothetical protein